MPSELAFKKARKVIECLSEFEKEEPHICPLEGVEGGEIIIDLQNPDRETSILMVVESNGSGVLFFQVNHNEVHKRIDDAENLPILLKKIRNSDAETIVTGSS